MTVGLTHDSHGLAASKQTVRCANCGYGAVVRVLPEACPMCRGSAWQPEARRRFGHLHDLLDDASRGPTPAA